MNAADLPRRGMRRSRMPSWRWLGALVLATFAMTAGCTLLYVEFVLWPSQTDPEYRAAVQIDQFWGRPIPQTTTGAGSRARALAATGTLPSLASFTPTAAFLGNQTALVGAALKPESSLAGSLLVRENDCSLTQYSFADTATGATPSLTRLPGFDAYAHRIAGLTTTAGVFAKGCTDKRLGIVPTVGTYLGRASNGDLLSVSVNSKQQITLIRTTTSGMLVGTTSLGRNNTGFTVATADLNGDGIADIVSANLTVGGITGIGVFLSRADGSFNPAIVHAAFPAAVAAAPESFYFHVVIEDINGDGKPDIVAVGANIFDFEALPTVLTLLGMGDGSFRTGSLASKAISLSHLPFVVADFNGDGKADMLTASGAFLPGAGDGTFGTPATAVDLGRDYPGSRSLAVGDFNDDGKLDVAFLSATGHPFISITLGNGDGTFTLKATYASINGGGDDGLSVTDIDGDGRADIVVGLSGPGAYGPNPGSNTVMQFLLGRGDGTFAGAPAIPGVGFTPTGGVGAPTFALADFNGDGYPDLMLPAAGRASAVVLQLGTASGQFGAAGALVPLSVRPQMVAAADLNRDGKPDLVLATNASLSVLFGLGGGSFGAERAYALPAANGKLRNLAVGDVNGDGRADVIVVLSGGTAPGTFLYIANADGSLKAPVQIDTFAGGPLVMGDLTSDGRADIVVGATGGGIRVYRGNADGSVSLTASLSLPGAAYYSALAIGDMNQDGKADLVIVTQTAGLNDTVFIAPGNGDGSFGTATPFVLPGGGPLIRSIALADFTFDGKLDVIAASDGYAVVLPGNGDGTLSGMAALAIAGGGTYVTAADLNNDTVPDAVMAIDQLGIVPLLRVRSVLDPVAPPAPDFSLAATPSAQRVDAGLSASTLISAMPSGGLTGSVALSCSGLPAGASCSFTPAALDVGAGAASSMLTISTTSRASMAAVSVDDEQGHGPGAGILAAAAAGLLVLGWQLKAGGRRSLVMLGAAALLNACGGGSTSADQQAQSSEGRTVQALAAPKCCARKPPSIVGTPAGSYVVTVVGTAGALVRTTTFELTVN